MATQRIYIGGLPDDIEKEDIETVLQRACKISAGDLPDIVQNVWCAKNPPGFAFVVFSDRKYADIAVEELHEKELFGREIKVEIARDNQGERKPRGRGRGGPRDSRGGFRGGSRGGFRGGFRDGPPDRRGSRGGFRSPRRSPSPFRSRPTFRRSPSPYRAQGRDRFDQFDRLPRDMPLRNDFSPPRYGGMDDRRLGFGGGRRDEPIRRYDMPRDNYGGGGGGYGAGGYGRMQRRSMSPPRRSPPPRFQTRRSPPGRSPPRRGRGGGRGRGRGGPRY